ncbi:hypothetical protein ETA57_05105 [Bacillus licheniformis]|uniref:hypothetical protein n=1 Tax=Bacillus licheniformis TaxID=1402 RepID=UPI00084B8397|nr:hypothetical protein [Bacillus licheniformis]AOP14000.1 hypothetical protein BL1202_01049 [Bacillus licheniformis]PAC90612.1 hypothetical protein CHH99_21045 [Bacillus licheniformis]QAW27982.1 hypothetical protein ETA57_05105 [Bacillus licheniformis]
MTKTNEKIHVLADESLGGIKREYVEVDRNADVGDRVIADGTYREVVAISSRCGVCLDGDESIGIPHSYRVLEPTNIVHIDGPDGTERYEMVDRKAEVGEKIVVVDDEDSSEEFGNFRIGEVGTVESYATDDTYFGEYVNVRVSDERGIPLYLHEYRVLVPVESSEEEPQPSDPIDVIANLATRVAELERENKRIKDEIDTLHKDNRRHGEEIAQLEKGVHAQSQRHLYRQQEIERVWERMDRIESETESLKYAAKETDGKVANLESDSDTRLFTAEEVAALLNAMRERR